VKPYIEIDLENDALCEYSNSPGVESRGINYGELGQILRKLDARLASNKYKKERGNIDSILDTNGNTVCRAYMEEN